MPKNDHDRQLVVGLLADAADTATLQQATDLDAKPRAERLPTELVVLPPSGAAGGDEALHELGRALRGEREVPLPMSARSRLYLVGRGDWRRQTLSGRSAADVAGLLGRAGLSALRAVSVVADELGRDRSSAAPDDLRDPADSFASRLHAVLRERLGLETVLQARVYPVVVAAATGSQSGPERGRKLTVADGLPMHHRPRSKLRFVWRDGVQRREWAGP